MLRSKKFRTFEAIILTVTGLLLVGAAGVAHGDWRILIAAAGIGGLAAGYLLAAGRGRPL